MRLVKAVSTATKHIARRHGPEGRRRRACHRARRPQDRDAQRIAAETLAAGRQGGCEGSAALAAHDAQARSRRRADARCTVEISRRSRSLARQNPIRLWICSGASAEPDTAMEDTLRAASLLLSDGVAEPVTVSGRRRRESARSVRDVKAGRSGSAGRLRSRSARAERAGSDK